MSTTIREANDRGYECLILEDCTVFYVPEFYHAEVNIIKAHRGLFGWVAESMRFLQALN